YLPRYKELVKKLNIENNVSFLGFVPDEDLPKIYRDVDIAVLPTYSTAEGFGMVLAEANACATPVIGSKIGGIPVVIENEYNGLLVPPKDVKELSKAIKRIFNDKDLSSKLSKNGVQKAKENWDWDNLAEKTFKIFSN
ncbi:glycosyltransferase family 4 protein, partial [Candidatus Woesearchaeota archaeon]|nr:glycosyltransferase family 4 protein [Candidatus Woesearchaeota archaeon]